MTDLAIRAHVASLLVDELTADNNAMDGRARVSALATVPVKLEEPTKARVAQHARDASHALTQQSTYSESKRRVFTNRKARLGEESEGRRTMSHWNGALNSKLMRRSIDYWTYSGGTPPCTLPEARGS